MCDERPIGVIPREEEDSGVAAGAAPSLALSLVMGLLLLSTGAWSPPLSGQSLRGSHQSMDIQNRVARQHDFTYIANSPQVRRFVSAGYLVPLEGNGAFSLDSEVSFPYARPEVRTFIRRLARQYRSACGEQLVVTSLTRPQTRQPYNASDRSVHPTGMAVDLRRSTRPSCRGWLESVLISLEEQGVLEATRERYPPHYHIAVFPEPYSQYVARLVSSGESSSLAAGTYEVRPGDSLWSIARSMGVTVYELRAANDLGSNRIHPGQRLRVPEEGARMAASALDYRVQSGDSLWKIARSHRTSVDRIREQNGLSSDRIRPGQVLTVPVGR